MAKLMAVSLDRRRETEASLRTQTTDCDQGALAGIAGALIAPEAASLGMAAEAVASGALALASAAGAGVVTGAGAGAGAVVVSSFLLHAARAATLNDKAAIRESERMEAPGLWWWPLGRGGGPRVDACRDLPMTITAPEPLCISAEAPIHTISREHTTHQYAGNAAQESPSLDDTTARANLLAEWPPRIALPTAYLPTLNAGFPPVEPSVFLKDSQKNVFAS